MTPWRTYWAWFSLSLTVLALGIAGLVWVVDPYQNLPASAGFERAPLASNQRYAYPAVARSAAFDSLVVGT